MNPAIDFFHPNVCHICKITCKDVKLKRCSQCRMIAYCSSSHQRKDWKAHKELCKTVVQVLGLKELKLMKEKLKNDRLQLRSSIMTLCEVFLGRKLDAVEMHMVYFQRSCSVCDSDEDLEDCPACLTNSVCINHRGMIDNHGVDCRQLQLCLEAHLFKSKDYWYPSYEVRSEINHEFIDMESFLAKNTCIDTGLNPLSMAMISDWLTRPLTVLYALSVLKSPFSERLTIHIIGSNNFETATAQHWDVLRKVHPTRLQLSFIGPDIETSFSKCLEGMTIHSSTELYHDFNATDLPDVIVAFNCGFHEFEDVSEDTWGPSLSTILLPKVPVVLTSYTASEATLDVARLLALDPKLRVRQFSNPFASLSPLRDVESEGAMDRDRRRNRDLKDKRDDRRDGRRDHLQSASSAAEKSSRLRMDSYSERNRTRPASPPRRKEIDNVMKKARRDGTDKSHFWNKKLLEVEEKDPSRWRHSGYKELYVERSPSLSKSRSRSPAGKRAPPKASVRPRSPNGLSSSARGRKSRSRSPVRAKPPRPGASAGNRGRPSSPPPKGRRSPPPKRPRSPAQKHGRSPSGSSDSVSSCSDDSCSVCSPKQTRRKAAPRSRSRSFSVPRSSRPLAGKLAGNPAKPASGPGSKSTATIGRKPPPKPTLSRVEAARSANNKSSPPRDPRTSASAAASAAASKTRKDAPVTSTEKSPVKRSKMLAAVKIEGQKKAPPPESDSDDSSSSSDASGGGAPKMTLSERFGKMAQWSVDRRDIDYVNNMKITKQSDSTGFKVTFDGPDEEEIYRTAAPEFADRRVGAGYFPETMHAAPVGLSSWDDVRVRYKYYKGRGYLRDLSLDDYMKWEEWWYKYQEWVEAERYYEQWADMQPRRAKRRQYRNKHSPLN